MKKEELQKHYEFLEATLKEFRNKEQHYVHGKTSKIRKRALTYMESYLKRFERYVTENKKLHEFVLADTGIEGDKSITWDEINSIPFFSRDLPFVLKRIEGMPGEME